MLVVSPVVVLVGVREVVDARNVLNPGRPQMITEPLGGASG
jgi:hypothetical protein